MGADDVASVMALLEGLRAQGLLRRTRSVQVGAVQLTFDVDVETSNESQERSVAARRTAIAESDLLVYGASQ